MTIKTYNWLIGAAWLAISFAAAPLKAQSLQSAIESALANDPSLAASGAMVDMENARLDGARAASRSSLGLQGSLGASNADFGGGYKVIYPRALTLAWEKRLYDGGAALARIDASEFALAAQNGQHQSAKINLILATIEAYSNLYVAVQMHNYADDALKSAQRMARDAGLQFNVGEVAIGDKALAEASMHRAEAALAKANGQIRNADANLYRLTNTHFSALDLAANPPPLPASEALAKEQAKENHPLIATSKAQLAAAEAQIRLANTARQPNVSVSARANTVRDQFLAGYKSDDVGAYLNFSMPLWDNGRTKSAQGIARAGRDNARANLRAAERMIEMGVTNAFVDYETAKAEQIAAGAAAEAMQIAFNSAQAQMRVGEKPISDVLDARTKLTEAQSVLARANAAIVVARYKIALSIGTL